ncbi:MAG: indole-3-glycerol phosphate synthase TrpC, partial [Pseudomonadota bacterium]
EKFFKGHADFLKHARAACNLPVLRKDFLYDTYQVTESRAMNADCILIIMASVDDACAQDLLHAAKDLQMDALIEVHDEIELERALQLDAKMIGINNRNLRDFSVDIATSKRLAKLIPDDRLIVSESGISTPQEAQILNEAGISTFLIGETFMREADVAAALGNFLNNADRSAI